MSCRGVDPFRVRRDLQMKQYIDKGASLCRAVNFARQECHGIGTLLTSRSCIFHILNSKYYMLAFY